MIVDSLLATARRVTGAGGVKGVLLTVALGAVAALALPPLHILPALVAFSGLAWRLERARTLGAAAATGWLFALGYHVAGLYWISNALLVEGDRFAWAVPFAALGLPMVLAAFPALALAPVALLSGPRERTLAVLALWSLAEYLRSILFTGFPWNLAGYAFAGSDALAQAAAWVGIHGLGLAVLAPALAPALFTGARGHRPWTALAALAVPLLLWAGGQARLDAHPADPAAGPVVRLVQGNIPQRDKWDRDLRDRHLVRYRQLTIGPEPEVRQPGLAPGAAPLAVIWPETAVPAFLNTDGALQRWLDAMAPEGGSLVAGAPARDAAGLFNSAFVFDGRGGVAARYDKAHLVPFGEYLPLRDRVPLPVLFESFIDFSPGPGRVSMPVPGLGPASPLICYEAIFPGEVVAAGAPRPALLLNLTNDAWYGHSAGPYQHRTIARMRAVEEGIPLVRAANTGISGVYDALGRTVAEIGFGVTGALDARLPPALPVPTAYARHGELAWACLVVLVLACAAWMERARRAAGKSLDRHRGIQQ